jgi:hypothetical protein
VRISVAIVLAVSMSSAASACGLIAGVSDYAIVDEADQVNPGPDGQSPSAPSSSGTTTTPSDDGGGPSQDAATSDATSLLDGGGDAADASLTLAPRDRFRVTCGTQTCDTENQRCCITAGSMMCLATAGTTCNGSELNCDEEEDCRGAGGGGGGKGDICCLGQDLGNPTAPSTGCLAQCNDSDGTRARVCKSAQECPNNQPCIPIFCKVRVLGTCAGRIPNICK